MPTPLLQDTLRMATDSLRGNKLRSGLTVLGVVIGISSVIALNSIGNGVQRKTAGLLQSLGTDIIVVLAGNARVGLVGQGTSDLTLEDAEAVETQSPAVQSVAAFLTGGVSLVSGDRSTFVRAMGTEANFPQVRTWPLEQGRFFTDNDVESLTKVAVLGSTTRDRVFGTGASVVGESIRVEGERFRILGVLTPKGGLGGADPDDQVYIPLTTMSTRIVGGNSLNGIALTGFFAKARSQPDVTAAQFQITNLLRLRSNTLPGQDDDFSITSQVDIQQTLDLVVGLFTVFIVSIGAVSLVVGGIGIANIMLVSVVERTREIGVRKALGASSSSILYQFLSEAILVSLGGGALGIVIGVSLAALATALMEVPLVISGGSVVLSFSLSLAVGLLAGVLPARSAAQLDPITALRTD